MDFSWMLLVTAPFYLALTTARDSEELYLVQNLLGNELTCMSEDDDAALVWNYDISTNESRDGFNDFKPAKPMNTNDPLCAVWGLTGRCLAAWKESDNWDKVSSLVEPMGPVVDYRWEGFEEEVWSKHSLCSGKRSRPSDGTVVFSVRGTRDIRVQLCDFESYWCLVVTIAITSPNSTIHNCRIRRSYAQSGKNQACTLINSTKHETPVLDAYEWRTFRFQWIGNAHAIKVFRDTEKEAFLQGPLPEWHRVCNIGIESVAGARIKLHAYNYIRMKSASGILATNEFVWRDKNFCIDMLVSLCPWCQLDVSLRDSGTSEELAKESIFGAENYGSRELKIWRSIKLDMNLPSSSPTGITLNIRSLVNGNIFGSIWFAIDNLRSCDRNGGVRESTIGLPARIQGSDRLPATCQKLFHGKIVSAKSWDGEPCLDMNRLRACIRSRRKSCFSKCKSNQGFQSTVSPKGAEYYDAWDPALVDSSYRPIPRELTRISKREIVIRLCVKIIPYKTYLTVDDSSGESSACSQSRAFYTIEIFDESNKTTLFFIRVCSRLPCNSEKLLKPDTQYYVNVTDRNGLVYSRRIRTLESAPGPILNLQFPFVSADSVGGVWQPPARTNGRIRIYTVTIQMIEHLGCRDLDRPSPPSLILTKNAMEPTAFFTNLHPYAKYNFSVIANTVEPGPSLSQTFETLRLDIPTSTVSSLQLFNESWLKWDPPEDCTTITGNARHVRLFFWNVSNNSRESFFMDQTVYSRYDLSIPRLALLPYTKYKVHVHVIRNYHEPENTTEYQSFEWMTAPTAPPAVKNFIIYNVDAENVAMSIRWQPPHPPNGEIKSYQVLIIVVNGPIKMESIEVSKLENCVPGYHCFENLYLPKRIPIYIDIELQIFAKNENVTAEGTRVVKQFTLNDLYNQAPGQPENITETQVRPGIVQLRWVHPSFTLTRIVRFWIEVHCLRTNLAKSRCKSFRKSVPIVKNEPAKSYFSTELDLLTSSEYHVYVMAENHHIRTSKPISKRILTPDNVAFASKEELEVNSAGPIVEIRVPAVVNPTRNTTVVVTVKGLSLCELKSSESPPPLPVGTESIREWIAAEYYVNTSESIIFTFALNQHYGVERNCSFQPQETYEVIVELKNVKTLSSLRSTQFTFNNREELFGKSNIWLVIIPILVICSLFFLLCIWYRKHGKSPVQTSHSQEVSLEPAYMIPINPKARDRSQGVPLNEIYETIPDDLERQTSDAREDTSEPSYETIPADLKKQISRSQDIISDSQYMNIAHNPREQTSHSRDILLTSQYMNITGNSREQTSHSQNVPLDRIYETIPDDLEKQISHARGDPSEPLYLEFLDK